MACISRGGSTTPQGRVSCFQASALAERGDWYELSAWASCTRLIRPLCAIRYRRLRVNAKHPQQKPPMRMMPPTMGSAIATARCQPWRPPLPPVPVDGGAGPAISVSLKMASASGKKGLPGSGGSRQAMCRAWRTFIRRCVSISHQSTRTGERSFVFLFGGWYGMEGSRPPCLLTYNLLGTTAAG
jgi:hypothetical protein